MCALRKNKAGGGVAVLLRDGLTYRERPDLGTFDEGVFESVFVEIVRGGGRRNDIVGVVYRPPGGDLARFRAELARVLGLLRGTDAYILGDFNVDLLGLERHGPTSDYMGEFTLGGFYPLISLDEVRALGVEENVARFRNSFRDLYNESFPWVEVKRRKRDEEKPWLDDLEFKELVKEKERLYSRKLKGLLEVRDRERLVEVSREVNSMRRRLKRAYFD